MQSNQLDPSSNIYGTDAGWHDVGNIELKLWNLSRAERSDLIYGNDRHQVLLIAKIKLIDSNGNPVPDQYCPSPSDIRRLSEPVNYDDGLSLGTGISVGWSYSGEQNAFLNPIQSTSNPVKEINIRDDYIFESCAYLHFYIQTEQRNSLATIGFCVEIRDKNGFLVRRVESTSDGKFHSSVEIRSISEIIFQSSDFQWSGIQKFHGGDTDDGLQMGRPSDNNLWREYAYSVTLDDRKYADNNNHIYRGFVIDDSVYQKEYSFGLINNGFYTFSGYLWPNNLYDENNVKLPNGTPLVRGECNEYAMKIDGAPERKTTVHNAQGTLLLSLLCAFGTSFKFGYIKIPLSVGVYDQYGNYGVICVNPDLLPDKYISSSQNNGLQTLKFFTNNEEKQPSHEQKEYYVYIQNSSKQYPRNATTEIQRGEPTVITARKGSTYDYFETEVLFKIEPQKYDENEIDSFYLESSTTTGAKALIGPFGIISFYGSYAENKFKIAPCWKTSSTCIADSSYERYMALLRLGTDGVEVILFVNGAYTDPALWPTSIPLPIIPFPISFAVFEWLFLPDKDAVI